MSKVKIIGQRSAVRGQWSHQRGRCRAFTLAEMLISVILLAFLVLLVSRLVNSASTIATLGSKRMDADSQARQVLDRMAVDFTQMVKRKDVSYYLKAGGNNMTGAGGVGVNDRMAFFCTVPGSYPTSSNQSPFSLVAYRVSSEATSSFNKMQRMGKGLIWTGVSSTYIPIIFLDPPNYTQTINNIWNSATVSGTIDPDYDLIGPHVFRFEYYYLLSTGAFAVFPPNWTSVAANVVSPNINDAVAVVVAIAVIDPRSRVILTSGQTTTLIGRLPDYTAGMVAGQLLSTWQTALDGITDLPRAAISNVRLYERFFYLPPASQ